MAEDSAPQSKKTSLGQQVKEQVKRIQELTSCIQEKEQELAALTGKAALVDQLTTELHATEAAMNLVSSQLENQAQIIAELTNQLLIQEEQLNGLATQATLSDQLQEIQIKLAAVSMQNRHTNALMMVKTHMVAGMALGLLPAPLFDIAALSGVQLNLLRSLCIHYQVDFDEHAGKGILTSLICGSFPVLAVMSLSSFAKLIPGIGTIGGGMSMTVLAGAVIYATGVVFIRHFEAGGSLQNFDSKHWHSFFKQQFDEGKSVIKSKPDMPVSSAERN